MQVLFLNMESDIGAAAAFVFAHNEAIKGMEQMNKVIEDAYDCLQGEGNEAAEADKALVKQVCLLLSEHTEVKSVHYSAAGCTLTDLHCRLCRDDQGQLLNEKCNDS